MSCVESLLKLFVELLVLFRVSDLADVDPGLTMIAGLQTEMTVTADLTTDRDDSDS